MEAPDEMTEPRFDCPSCARVASVHCHHPDCDWLWCHHCELVYDAFCIELFFISAPNLKLIQRGGEVFLERG